MNEILVYIFDTNKTNEAELLHLASLTNDDLRTVEKYKDETQRKEKIVSMYLKRRFVGDYYLSENEKPLAKGRYFNVSHSHGLVAIALSKTSDVGIDLELVRSFKESLKEFVCSPKEAEFAKDNKDFYKVWTAKEALTKCIGTGVSIIKKIPALPVNGMKEFEGNRYYSKCIEYFDCIINVTSKEEFNLKIENLN